MNERKVAGQYFTFYLMSVNNISNQPWIETSTLSECSKPVSYTHLDVYKRQLYVFVVSCDGYV